MKFLTFIRSSESFRDVPPPAALMEAMGKFVEQSFRDKSLVETGGLLPSKNGKRIRLAKGKLVTTDGPFTEAKEVIGGWAILEADTMEQAMVHATAFMKLHLEYWPEFEGEAEIRPIVEPGGQC